MVHIFRKVACLFAEDFVYSHFVGGKTIFLYTMLKKQLYMAPEAEPLVVQIEGVICQSDVNANTVEPGILDDWGVFNLL